MVRAILYQPQFKDEWNQFVRKARNATFLFERDFMDYHKDRFSDCSLLFLNDKDKCIGLLPANFKVDEDRVDSHGGLTYGGLLTTAETSFPQINEMLKLAAAFYIPMGAKTLRYKPTPYIYHKYPTEEDLYCLFRAHAVLTSRTISSTIDLHAPLPFSTLRKRKTKKALKNDLTIIEENQEKHWVDFWNILSDVLEKSHHTHPVHSLEEIRRLADSFPENIRLCTIHKNDVCLAGCLIFDCDTTIHVQYIASSDEGKTLGALDLLFEKLIRQYKEQGKHYFDFGISTEKGGLFLNEGLLFQKEGFGGRAICYDTYEVSLENFNK